MREQFILPLILACKQNSPHSPKTVKWPPDVNRTNRFQRNSHCFFHNAITFRSRAFSSSPANIVLMPLDARSHSCSGVRWKCCATRAYSFESGLQKMPTSSVFKREGKGMWEWGSEKCTVVLFWERGGGHLHKVQQGTHPPSTIAENDDLYNHQSLPLLPLYHSRPSPASLHVRYNLYITQEPAYVLWSPR